MVIWLIKKIANKVTIKSSQNTSATVEHEWKIPKKRWMSLEQKQQIIDEWRLRCQQIINMLYNTTNQPSKFRAKNWVKINYVLWGTYNTTKQIKFKISTVKLNLCYYRDGCILVKGIIRVPNKK